MKTEKMIKQVRPILSLSVWVLLTLLVAIGLYELGRLDGYIEASEGGKLPIPRVVSNEK